MKKARSTDVGNSYLLSYIVCNIGEKGSACSLSESGSLIIFWECVIAGWVEVQERRAESGNEVLLDYTVWILASGALFW